MRARDVSTAPRGRASSRTSAGTTRFLGRFRVAGTILLAVVASACERGDTGPNLEGIWIVELRAIARLPAIRALDPDAQQWRIELERAMWRAASFEFGPDILVAHGPRPTLSARWRLRHADDRQTQLVVISEGHAQFWTLERTSRSAVRHDLVRGRERLPVRNATGHLRGRWKVDVEALTRASSYRALNPRRRRVAMAHARSLTADLTPRSIELRLPGRVWAYRLHLEITADDHLRLATHRPNDRASIGELHLELRLDPPDDPREDPPVWLERGDERWPIHRVGEN